MFCVSVFLLLNLQRVFDYVSFWSYQPTSAVAAIADRAGLTDEGTFMFYASQPVIEGTSAFNTKCDRKEKNIAILGCYVAGKIYIFDVNDERLNGIEEVSATHEMLHAVYERMSDDEKRKINKLVEAEFAKLEANPEFSERMAFYARTEPGERDNELHSIIGTEVAPVSDELEAHYEKYFDRSTILALYADYKSEFTRLTNRADSLKAELDKLKKQIDSSKARYHTDITALDRDISQFNERAKNGSFTSQAQFATEREALVRRANQVKAQREAVNALVDRYNKLRKEHNSIITQSNELYQSIDSSLAPAPKV